MRVILVYDISLEDCKDQSRLNKVRKVVRKYINHVQKSVFEGDISPSKLEKMKKEILEVIDKKRDSVIVYVFDDISKYERQVLTDITDPTDNLV